MSMLHGIVRAATVALVVVIAVLVYVNYFRGADTDVSGMRSELAVAPELPKIAVAPETPTPPAPPVAAGLGVTPPAAAVSETTRPAQSAATETPRPAAPVASTAPSRPARTEASDDKTMAEIVELPPANNPRAASVPFPMETLAPAPTPKTPGTSSAAGKRTHVVAPGESLWLISKKMYGNAELYGKIAEANGINAKDRVRVGQLLVIPDANGSSEAAVAVHSAPVIDDLDHEDTPRTLKVSHTPEEPATMSATVKLK